MSDFITCRQVFELLHEQGICPGDNNYTTQVRQILSDKFKISYQDDDAMDILHNRAVYFSGRLREAWKGRQGCQRQIERMRGRVLLNRKIKNTSKKLRF